MTIGIFEAKTRLSELIEEVQRGGRVVITRHGREVAVLGPVPGATPPLADTFAAVEALRTRVHASEAEIRDWVREGREG